MTLERILECFRSIGFAIARYSTGESEEGTFGSWNLQVHGKFKLIEGRKLLFDKTGQRIEDLIESAKKQLGVES